MRVPLRTLCYGTASSTGLQQLCWPAGSLFHSRRGSLYRPSATCFEGVAVDRLMGRVSLSCADLRMLG